MRKLRYLEAIAEGVRAAMAEDDTVFFLGEDVRQSLRGVSRGLFEEFGPDRVLDTPISEAAFTGFATGAAMAGYRPIVEYQISALIYVAFDQLVDQAQKIRFMTGGQVKVPVTYIVPGVGPRRGLAGQHSDQPYPYLVHAGIKLVLPATAADARGLITTAIRDDDPVFFWAPAALMGARDDVDDAPQPIPLGQGRVHRPGTDVTIVATGHLVPQALRVAAELHADGISAEVWDPRTILPLDREGLAQSVEKTGRLVIFDDSNRFCGYAAEIAAFAAEELWSSLKQPVKRLTRSDVPVPFSLPLEGYVLPDPARLTDTIRRMLNGATH
jgi:pyruvate/2-oxoglutarate/acetoin dehydrogenase E1 component